MGILERFFGRSAPEASHGESDAPTAWPLRFTGAGVHAMPLRGTGFGVVFEDDGTTGYLYATNERGDAILDALHLYDHGTAGQLRAGEEAFLVWSATSRKLGFFYRERFQAVFDFANRRAACRSGFPAPDARWCKGSHQWDDDAASGLE